MTALSPVECSSYNSSPRRLQIYTRQIWSGSRVCIWRTSNI